MTQVIQSLSVGCRVVLDMHALNNEGNESNRLMTRQVGIVTPTYTDEGQMDYRRDVVNAISGDMYKHIFAEAFRSVALDMNLPLCEPCKALDPARMMADESFRDFVKSKPAVNAIIDRLLTCALDDVCGIMITGKGSPAQRRPANDGEASSGETPSDKGGTSVKRKSAIEFGWSVGLPEITEVGEFIHARHAPDRLTRTKAKRSSDEETKKKAQEEKGENLGQMIFNRPASSGVYAFVSNLEVSSIGFNDVTQEYPITPERRAERFRAAVLALGQTVLHPRGALTSTQLPHVVDIEGFVSISYSAAAAPMLSPLSQGFIERTLGTAERINRLHGEGAVAVLPFTGPEGLLDQLDALLTEGVPGRYRE